MVEVPVPVVEPHPKPVLRVRKEPERLHRPFLIKIIPQIMFHTEEMSARQTASQVCSIPVFLLLTGAGRPLGEY